MWRFSRGALQAEVERLLFEDPDPDMGFMLHPDLKWDQVANPLVVQSCKHLGAAFWSPILSATSRLRRWLLCQQAQKESLYCVAICHR
jgi:hypothetical protein